MIGRQVGGGMHEHSERDLLVRSPNGASRKVHDAKYDTSGSWLTANNVIEVADGRSGAGGSVLRMS